MEGDRKSFFSDVRLLYLWKLWGVGVYAFLSEDGQEGKGGKGREGRSTERSMMISSSRAPRLWYSYQKGPRSEDAMVYIHTVKSGRFFFFEGYFRKRGGHYQTEDIYQICFHASARAILQDKTLLISRSVPDSMLWYNWLIFLIIHSALRKEREKEKKKKERTWDREGMQEKWTRTGGKRE